MLLATHSDLQVGPDVIPESLLKVPTMSWTGRIIEPGEPELPSSCSLTETEDANTEDWDWDEDESLCLIYDLTRPLTHMPSAPPELDEAITNSLSATFSLDLDSIMLAASQRFGNPPEYSRDAEDEERDISDSIDEDSIYVGIMPIHDKIDRPSTSIFVLPIESL